MKCSGAIILKMESVLVEAHREITNVWKQGDEFRKEIEKK